MTKRKMSENSLKNLKPLNLSHDEAVKNGQKGGKISGKSRRDKRALKEVFIAFSEMNAPAEMKDKVLEVLPELDTENLSLKAVMVFCLIDRILKGDTKAFEIFRDTIGEKPTDKQEIAGDVNLLPTTFEILPVKGNDEI